MKVFAVCPHLHDSQSWWRAMGPLQDMVRVDQISLETPSQITWVNLRSCSLLFLQRPFDSRGVGIMQMAHSQGTPVVCDFDDDLWDLPKGNPAYIQYTPEWKDAARQCAVGADAVIVSTEQLAERVRSFKPKGKVHVIKNALPDFYKWRNGPLSKTVWWRGGDYHRHDIKHVVPQLIEIINKNPDWHWLFGGSNPFEITENITHDNHSSHSPIPIPEYHVKLQHVAPAIIINPLQDHPFNHSKSNIGWIEAALAGSALLAPDFPQFREPGVVNYKEGGFGEALQAMLDGQRPSVDIARRKIDAEYRLSDANKVRLKLFRELIGK